LLNKFKASQDVAQDKKLLETYEITHILNLAYGVSNAFEEDYNYKTLEVLDVPETNITKYFDECFEFINDARHYGNCLVHCNAGVSRSTAICTAYLMYKEKMNFDEALGAVSHSIFHYFLTFFYSFYFLLSFGNFFFFRNVFVSFSITECLKTFITVSKFYNYFETFSVIYFLIEK
jgi:hypothetical protein